MLPTTLFEMHDKLSCNYTLSFFFHTTISHGLRAVELRGMRLSRYSTLTAHGIIDIPTGCPFHIFFINFSDCGACLSNHLVIVNTAADAIFINAIDSIGQKVLSIEASEVGIIPAYELQFMGSSETEHVFAVYNEATEDRESQMLLHTFI